jgi:archaeal chaperonin
MSSLQAQQPQVPILLLKEGATETKKKDAQKNNILAAKLIAQILKSSLGPRGLDKMLVDPLGDVTITNDGATILKEIEVQHPAAKMMVEVTKSIDNEVGDGTTSVAVLAGSLLEKAEDLINKNVHATVIVDGYRRAAEKAMKVLREISTAIDPQDKEDLVKVAKTTMASKMISGQSEILANIVVDAILNIAEEIESEETSTKRTGSTTLERSDYRVDIDNIKVEKKAGASVYESRLIEGIVLDKEVVHGGMPKRVENAKIALVNSPMEIEKPEFDAKLNISNPSQMQKFLDEENNMLKSMVDKILSAGANVVLCQKGIDDMAQHYLARTGVLAVRRVKESDMSKLAKATGATMITNIDEITSNDLGNAQLVEERHVETDKWVFIEGCKNPKAISILLRGGSQRVVDEAERSVHDALMTVKDVVEYPYIVPGGGAPEALVSQQIREWSNSLDGRAQLAADQFADSIETIPLVLAENAGMDPIDTQVQLRAKTSNSEKVKYGIDVINNKIADMTTRNVYEPLAVKENIVNGATEVASMILRIDDVIAASKSQMPPGPPGGGGAGGYGGGDYGDM